MRHDVVVAAAVVVLGLATCLSSASAQPEDRRRAPTAPAVADPCERFGLERERSASTPPGFDATVPAPRGATSFTGVGRLVAPNHEIASALPGPIAPTGREYQDCLGRRDR
jgi:hypothetical protein